MVEATPKFVVEWMKRANVQASRVRILVAMCLGKWKVMCLSFIGQKILGIGQYGLGRPLVTPDKGVWRAQM